MSPLPMLATVLHAAASTDDALRAFHAELASIDREAELALFRYDPRSQLLAQRCRPTPSGIVHEPVSISLGHFPRAVRVDLAGGARFVDAGTASTEYLAFLGWGPFPAGGKLHLRGIPFDGDLAAVLAIHEPRRLFGGASQQAFDGIASLFALAYVRIIAVEARGEASRVLEELTHTIHAHYGALIAKLERELDETRAALVTGDVVPAPHAAELAARADCAAAQAAEAARKLVAVERQVAEAVGRLESAHVELHGQSERLRALRDATHAVRQLLRAALEQQSDDASLRRALALLDQAV